MPTYEYECTKCGHRFDVFQKISDDPITACEKCSCEVRKVFSPVGIVFKGSGFYVTDYCNKNGKSSNTKTEASK